MKRFFTKRVNAEVWAVEALARAAHARGLDLAFIASREVDPRFRQVVFTVIGERAEDEGWDADGAPTDEWPAPSMPWADPADERGVA